MTSKAYANAVDASAQQGGRRNLIINGAMQVAQRGTSFTDPNPAYTLDRWEARKGVSGVLAVTQEDMPLGQTDILGITKFARLDQTTARTSNLGMFRTKLEDVTLFDNQTFTLSFYAKSNVTKEIDFNAFQRFGSGGSSAVVAADAEFIIGTSWDRYTFTFDSPSLSGKTVGTGSHLELDFRDESLGTFTLDITGVQLEVGSVATPFEHRSYGEELALCQRYYQRAITSDSGDNLTVGGGSAGTTTMRFVWPLSTPLRSSPTITQTGTGWKRFNDSSESSSTDTPTIYKYYAYASYIGLSVANYSGSFGDNRVASTSPQNLTALNFDAEL